MTKRVAAAVAVLALLAPSAGAQGRGINPAFVWPTLFQLGGASTAYREDSAHVSGHFGSFVLAVRNDAGGTLCNTTGDYCPFQLDATGQVRVVAPLPTGASTDRTTAAAPFAFRLSDGAAFYDATKTGQLPAALVSGRLDANVGAWLGSTAPTVGQKVMASSLPVALASDQPAVPISAASLPLPSGAAQDGTLTGGTLKAIARGGAKGATTAADVTGTAEGADHQAVDVQIYSGGVAKDPTAIRALTSADAVTAVQGTAAATSGAWPAKLTDGTNVTAVKAASTAAAAADPAAVVSLSPNSALPTGANTIGALTANQSVNLNQVAGAAAATAASGVLKVGVVGSAGGAVDAANNATAPANVVQEGWQLQSGAQATAGTAGQVGSPVAGLDHVPYVRLGGPVFWHCGLTAIGATLTQCKAAPAAGLKAYVTDIYVVSDTATAGSYTLRYGTGSNCVTGTTTLFPDVAATTAGKIPYPANTANVPQSHAFLTPLQPAAANAVCVICVATNTCTISMQGYEAP